VFEITETETFSGWMRTLDGSVKGRIAKRIERMASGNFGDHKAIGKGVSELRLDIGPGYRVYYTKRGTIIILLLCGGDKSTQAKDIVQAQAMVASL
jgi:putative addiction module killer protein